MLASQPSHQDDGMAMIDQKEQEEDGIKTIPSSFLIPNGESLVAKNSVHQIEKILSHGFDPTSNSDFPPNELVCNIVDTQEKVEIAPHSSKKVPLLSRQNTDITVEGEDGYDLQLPGPRQHVDFEEIPENDGCEEEGDKVASIIAGEEVAPPYEMLYNGRPYYENSMTFPTSASILSPPPPTSIIMVMLPHVKRMVSSLYYRMIHCCRDGCCMSMSHKRRRKHNSVSPISIIPNVNVFSPSFVAATATATVTPHPVH